MNLATLRSRVANATGLTNSGTEQALIDSWLNEAILQWLMETKMVKATASISATSGVGDYTLDYSILSFEDVWYGPADATVQQVLMTPVDSADIRRMRLYQNANPTQPRYYALEGTNLFMIYPSAVSSGDLVHMIYTAAANSAMSATANDPSNSDYGWIPAEWHPALECYAKWKASEYNDSPRAQSWQQEWMMWIGKGKVMTNKKSGTRLPAVRLARNRRNMPVTPGTDMRR